MILNPIIDLLKRIVVALPDYAGGGGEGLSPFVAVVGEVTPVSDSTSMGFPTDGKFANVSDIFMFFAYVDDYTQYTEQNNMIVGGYKFNSHIKTPTGVVSPSTIQTIDTSKTPPLNFWAAATSEIISGNSYVISNSKSSYFKAGVKYNYILVGVEV